MTRLHELEKNKYNLMINCRTTNNFFSRELQEKYALKLIIFVAFHFGFVFNGANLLHQSQPWNPCRPLRGYFYKKEPLLDGKHRACCIQDYVLNC